MKNEGFTIRCSGHHYVTLEWNEEFVFCLDNSMIYAEEIIYEVEKRTKMNFKDIPIRGSKEDFQGLRFLNGGWRRDFWADFPDKQEIRAYMKMKYGRI